MTKEEQIINRVNKMFNVNVYENRKTQNLVDLRSLCCYILHKDSKITLYKIRDHFISKGKKSDHATVLYSSNSFEEVRKRRPELNEARDYIMKEIDSKYYLIKIIQGINDKQKILDITNCIKYNS